MNSLKYRSDIDGLRAVIVLGVVIYHGYPWVHLGGFPWIFSYSMDPILTSSMGNMFSRIPGIFIRLLCAMMSCVST